MKKKLTYKDAGVDIVQADAINEEIAKMAKSTHSPDVIGGIGGFAGMFSLKRWLKQPPAQPTHQEISELAYWLWEKTKKSDVDCWLEAEKRLREILSGGRSLQSIVIEAAKFFNHKDGDDE